MMTTSPRTSVRQIGSPEGIYSKPGLTYLRARLQERLYQAVLERFLEFSEGGFTKAELARRTGRTPEQISAWLGSPGNWTLGTVSDLLAGMDVELKCMLRPLGSSDRRVASMRRSPVTSPRARRS
jgi:hypothetical protein